MAKRASAICARRQGQALKAVLTYVEKHSGQGKSEAALQAEAIHSHFLPPVEAEIDELAALSALASGKGQFDAFVSDFRGGVEKIKKQQYDASEVADFGSEFHAAGKRAESLGLSGCAFT